METRYSKERFDGFTHRFIIKLKFDDDVIGDMYFDIYSNSSSCEAVAYLVDFVYENTPSEAKSLTILHIATKEQDELSSRFIDKIFADGDLFNVNNKRRWAMR